jgi:hypothetical protein
MFSGILGMRRSRSETVIFQIMSSERGAGSSVKRFIGAEAVPDPLITNVEAMFQILHQIHAVKSYSRWSSGCAICHTI